MVRKHMSTVNLKETTESPSMYATRFFNWCADIPTTIDFSQTAQELMKLSHWNAVIFETLTLLDDDIYYKICSGIKYHPAFVTVIAICVGLNLSLTSSGILLRCAGFTFDSHREFEYIISEMQGESIHERNLALVAFGENCLGKNL
ncbi:hypothetical protein FACS1894105_05330 [Clostridia bacterium]|nr:hypothetical protein FACS1894105_05330 [Clostridia bacterium]